MCRLVCLDTMSAERAYKLCMDPLSGGVASMTHEKDCRHMGREGGRPVKISEGTFRRLFLVSTISGFPRGCMGSLRLQKVVYTASHECEARPFTYLHYHHGQFSRDLSICVGELKALGLVEETREGGDATCFRLVQSPEIDSFTSAGKRLIPHCEEAVKRAVRTVGMLKEPDLYRQAHEDPALERTQFGEVILESNLGSVDLLIDLPSEDAEDLELALSPRFVAAVRSLDRTLSSGALDLSRVQVMSWKDIKSSITTSSTRT